MSSVEDRQPWELEDENGESSVPAYPTNEPIEEDERGELAKGKRADEPTGEEGADQPSDEEEDADEASGEDEDAGPMDDGDPPPERTHEDEGEVGAGSQYAAEDARNEHAEPQGPAGAA